jgi:peptidoglycan/xylan/chitin deacetylase (PgdA/CDA1 family)
LRAAGHDPERHVTPPGSQPLAPTVVVVHSPRADVWSVSTIANHGVAATSMRQDIVLWSVTRGEKRWRTPERVAQHVVGKVGRGDIIDVHDGIGRGTFVPASDLAAELMRRRQVEVEALPEIIERLPQRGIHLGTVSDLRSARDGRG